MRPATSSARRPRNSVLVDPDNEVEFFYLRPRDIAIYVCSGKLDIGITGRDLLMDSGCRRRGDPPARLRPLHLPLRHQARHRRADVADFGGMTVATSYEGIVAKHLADNGVDASVVHLDGAVETAIELGVAEVIADVVETGTTLRNAGLEVFGEPIMKSEAVVIRRTGAGRRRAQGAAVPAPPPGRPGRPDAT